MFADDTAIITQNKRFSVVISNLQHYISLLELWLTDWKVKVNASKSACLMFTRRPRLPVGLTPVQIFGQPVPWVHVAKHLGLFLDAKLTFANHIEQTCKKRRLFMPFLNGLSPVGVNLRSGISCQVIYSQFGLAIHQNDHQARRRFVEWAQNEIAVVPDFHKRILFSDEAHFWLNGYVNKQNCRIWSEANPLAYVETPLHPEKLTVWSALWAGGILLQKR
ncbi:hypothetical protein TNCV_3726391 [Trichonephila clavipes]|nr:hypothetical protein TNCV_3726391 [Trichonephila clavipes]